MWKELLEPIHEGEQETKDYLRQCGYKVEDVSENSKYWRRDIDLLCTNPFTGAVTSIEVKYDKRIADTQNFYIEIENPRSRSGAGWYKFCEADLIFYIDAATNYTYIIEVAKLHSYIEENKSTLKTKSTSDGAKGYIVNVADMPINQAIYI